MRCQSCCKFVSMEEGEPEAQSGPELDGATVLADIRIVRTCAECGEELKEYVFNLESDLNRDLIEGHWDIEGNQPLEGHELELEAEDPEMTSRATPAKNPRYSKTYFGAKVSYNVTCSCGTLELDDFMADEVPASGMDEIG